MKNFSLAPSYKGILFFSLLLIVSIFPSAYAATNSAQTYSPKSTYVSPEKKAPMSFTSLGVRWQQSQPQGTSASLAVRFLNQKDKTWTAWFTLEADIDGDHNTANPSAFISTNLTDTFQYRIILESSNSKVTPSIENIQFTYINAKEKVQATSTSIMAAQDTSKDAAALTTKKTSLKVISRSQWGADESIRLYKDDLPDPQLVSVSGDYEEKFSDELKIKKKITTDAKGNKLTWPLEYPEKISKIVIHHTATSKNLNDPKQAIRDIYYWHTITRGWGDIGYNYIIDQQGNIYEGRFGGEGVVGAHAGTANVGSIGIAVLGNYQENDVPEPVITSLAALLKAKTSQYYIDPMGSSAFRGEVIPNIIGHKDVRSTSCPGEKLYAQLPAIRAMVKGEFKPTIIDRRNSADKKKGYDFTLQNTIPLIKFEPGQKQNVTITLKNTGTKNWGANSVIMVSRDEASLNFLVNDPAPVSNKIGKTVKPNETVTFTLPLQAGFKGGIAQFEVFPLIDGSVKVEKYLRIPMQLNAGRYDYEVKKITLKNPYIQRGTQTEAIIEVQNTGNVTWKKSGQGKVSLGTENPRDHFSQLLAKPGTRLGELQENEVAPGQIGHFKVLIKPAITGSLKDDFSLVMEGVTWFPFKEKSLEVFVYENKYAAELQVSDLGRFTPGEKKNFSVSFKNKGGVVWTQTGTEALKFDVVAPNGFKATNVKVTPSKVLPGQTATVTFNLQAPVKEGTYVLPIMPKLGNRNLLANPQKINLVVGKGSIVNPVTPATPSRALRVDLSFRGNPVMSANGSFKLIEKGKTLAQFVKNEKVSVTYAQQKYTVKTGTKVFTLSNPPRFEPVSGSILRIDNFENRPAWKPEYNDNEYRGALEVRFYQNELHVINEVDIESYLKGLAEISATEPYEKIKAVIVLARSYATFYASGAQEKFPGAPFHLTDDPEKSQKYLGYGFEKRNQTGVKAVNDTKGEVVTYQGKIIKTPYFSSDDGRTRSAEEVWGWKDTPYLKSVDDPGCKGKTMQGHGVGLSGCGSLYFAKQGKNYKQIIQYYFQGVQIEKK